MSPPAEGCAADEKIPTQTPDGDLIDPQEYLRGVCKDKPEAKALEQKLLTCNDRVNSKSKTTETCVEELLDWMEHVDHCVGHRLFNYLK